MYQSADMRQQCHEESILLQQHQAGPCTSGAVRLTLRNVDIPRVQEALTSTLPSYSQGRHSKPQWTPRYQIILKIDKPQTQNWSREQILVPVLKNKRLKAEQVAGSHGKKGRVKGEKKSLRFPVPMHHQPLGKPWLRRPKCKPPSFPPSRSLRFKRGRRSWPEKATKRKEPSHPKTQQQSQNKRSFFLSGVYHQTLNLKFTIVFPTTTPPLPTFFVVLLLPPLQFLSIQAASSSLPWPLFLADHVRFRRPTIAHFRFSFSFAWELWGSSHLRFASSSSLCAVLHPSLIGRNYKSIIFHPHHHPSRSPN